jgi:hypothetical protein
MTMQIWTDVEVEVEGRIGFFPDTDLDFDLDSSVILLVTVF